MDKYNACNELKEIIKAGIDINWCSKKEFAYTYQKYTKLSIKKILNILTSINKSYGIVWYHTDGFIFKFNAKSKLGKLEIDWGTYYSFFHVKYPKDLVTVGGKFGRRFTIHPNIYMKSGYELYFNADRICLPYEITNQNITSLIKDGHIHSWLDQVVALINANDGNGHMTRFNKICYQYCELCGDYIHVGKETLCDICIKEQ